jgi:hypothetical protein
MEEFMKKVVVTLITTGMLVAMGAAFGQAEQKHDVEVTLPQLVMIRIVDSTAVDLDGNRSYATVDTPDAVVFDLDTRYDEFSFDPTGTYSPDALEYNWDDVVVFSNATGWEVLVSLSLSTRLLTGDLFDWSKVSVPGKFDLGPNDVVGSDTATTGGWFSLDFGPKDFELALDGTEEADTYSVTVTYTISPNP